MEPWSATVSWTRRYDWKSRRRLSVVPAALVIVLVVPAAFVVRIKRSPEPMRSFSFSGFNPDGQMAAFTGAAEYHPAAAVGDYGPYYGSPAHESYGPSSSPVQDSYGPPASGAVDPHDKHRNQVSADSKEERYGNSVEQTGDKKRHRGKCRSFLIDRAQNEISSF